MLTKQIISDGESNILIISHNDQVIGEYDDGSIEPEDVSFYRDLSFVPHLIEKAYQLGLQDGKSSLIS